MHHLLDEIANYNANAAVDDVMSKRLLAALAAVKRGTLRHSANTNSAQSMSDHIFAMEHFTSAKDTSTSHVGRSGERSSAAQIYIKSWKEQYVAFNHALEVDENRPYAGQWSILEAVHRRQVRTNTKTPFCCT